MNLDNENGLLNSNVVDASNEHQPFQMVKIDKDVYDEIKLIALREDRFVNKMLNKMLREAIKINVQLIKAAYPNDVSFTKKNLDTINERPLNAPATIIDKRFDLTPKVLEDIDDLSIYFTDDGKVNMRNVNRDLLSEPVRDELLAMARDGRWKAYREDVE